MKRDPLENDDFYKMFRQSPYTIRSENPFKRISVLSEALDIVRHLARIIKC